MTPADPKDTGLTAAELYEDLHPILPQDFPVLLYWIADRLHLGRLRTGARVSDGLSARQFLIELAQAAEASRGALLKGLPGRSGRPEQRRWFEET